MSEVLSAALLMVATLRLHSLETQSQEDSMTSIPVHAVSDDTLAHPGRTRRILRIVWRRRLASWVAALSFMLCLISVMSVEGATDQGDLLVLGALLLISLLTFRWAVRAMPGGSRAAFWQGRAPWF